jgi:uncharacterized protein YjbI with pentapeptide repeats
MAVKRKHNPDFVEGVNVLGRKAWLKRPADADAEKLKSLRDAVLDDETPTSVLSEQKTESEILNAYHACESLSDYAASKVPLPFLGDPIEKGVIAGMGGTAALLFGAMGGPFLAAPVLLGTVGVFLVNPVRRFLARRKTKKTFWEKQKWVATGQYAREASTMVERYPHWNPNRSRGQKFTHKGTGGPINERATSWVDKNGVGTVRWKEKARWIERDRNEKNSSITYFFYPGMKLPRMTFRYPVKLPEVNMRGADVQITTIEHGSDFSGGDLRNINASGSRWNVLLKDACLRDAILVDCKFAESDLSGADITGADVTGARLPLDLTGVNITREQFDSLADVGNNGGRGAGYRVKEASMDDVLAMFGGDKDLVDISIWAGEVEIRDRKTSEVVFGSYDPDQHYIPYWSLENN